MFKLFSKEERSAEVLVESITSGEVAVYSLVDMAGLKVVRAGAGGRLDLVDIIINSDHRYKTLGNLYLCDSLL